MNRREFLGVAGAAVAFPYIMKFGREAQAQTLRVRRNLSTLRADDPFFAAYGQAIRKLHEADQSRRQSWRGQSLIHADFCAHGRDDFFLWHRHYITFFERICGEAIGDRNFALPYWDWTANNGRLPQPFFDNGPLNVTFWNDPSGYQSDNWSEERINTRGTRAITATRGLRDDPQRGGEFRPEAINGILRLSNFANFQTRLEGSPHDNGHVISGGRTGHMGNGLSPLDPIFWLHHCNVDRLFAQWQAARNRVPAQSRSYNQQFVDASGTPQSVTAAQAVEFTSLGYTYDILAEQQVATRGLSQPESSPLAARPIVEEPRVVGRNETAKPVKINNETEFTVQAAGLVNNIFSTRSFRPESTPGPSPRVAVEESRILARINVTAINADSRYAFVNVFINSPDPSPQSTIDSPFYAGSFSFFGAHPGQGMGAGGGGGHAGHQGHGGAQRTFLVDASNALRQQAREGRLNSEDVTVQVLPIPVEPGIEVNAQFTVTSVELISA